MSNLRDVEAITSIGASTKRDDPTSIGKFGVGFKAVFAYTHTPEIHSGAFHFRVHDLVVPEINGVKKPNMGARETRFSFPFDHPAKQPAQATVEVERALRALGDNTLLFLSHIRTIEYLLPDGSLGVLERVDHDGGRIEIRARHPGGTDTVSHWLRFQKDVEISDEDGTTKTCRIAIAYSLAEENDRNRRDAEWKIVPFERGQVSIYFPAEKETSNLRFHIHAPFASTVARDSVRDCEANRQLRDRIAELVVESLDDIRDRGMLTMSFLSVLPNQADTISAFYAPIRAAIVRAFRDEALTPTRSGAHSPATRLYRGPARIADVLDDDDLSLLTNHEPPLWAANPPQQNQRDDGFLGSLGIEGFGWPELIKMLSLPHAFAWKEEQSTKNKEHKQLIESWIEGKDDAWVMRFYALLGEACDAHGESMDAKEFRIVRADAGQGCEHVLPHEAFFPPEQETTLPGDIRIVKPSVYRVGRSEAQKKFAASFLKHVGVRPFDAKAAIELRLSDYDDPPEPERVGRSYFRDLKQFIAYWKRNPTDVSLFRSQDFLLGESEDDGLSWCAASDLCLDAPYLNTGLAALSSIHKKSALWSGYKNGLSKSQLKDFVGFLQAIGVRDALHVEEVDIYWNPNFQTLWQGFGETRETDSKIREDYSIDALEQYLEMKSIPAAHLVWQALIRADSRIAKARYRPNQQYETREVDSQIVHHLKSSSWIPDKSGVFRSPQDMTREDLRTEFPYDDQRGLLTAVGFGEHAKTRSEEYRAWNEAAKKMGFASAEVAEELKKLGLTLTLGHIRFLDSQCQRASQPEESVQNPERRRKGVLERRENAPPKESVSRERTIEPGARSETLQARAYLRNKYKNSEGQLICQCCHSEMPFKVGDEHYFEAVQCVRGLKHHHFENRLALCPTCAAMYVHARQTDDAEVLRSIIDQEVSDTASSAEIRIELAGQVVHLRFVGTHWFDLKTVLREHQTLPAKV